MTSKLLNPGIFGNDLDRLAGSSKPHGFLNLSAQAAFSPFRNTQRTHDQEADLVINCWFDLTAALLNGGLTNRNRAKHEVAGKAKPCTVEIDQSDFVKP